MKLFDLGYDYHFDILLESITNTRNGWTLEISKGFKKGLKKYSNNEKFEESFTKLADFIYELKTKPSIDDYPSALNVHNLNGKMKGFLSAHLVGTQIVLIFQVDVKNKILKLINLGNHSVYETFSDRRYFLFRLPPKSDKSRPR